MIGGRLGGARLDRRGRAGFIGKDGADRPAREGTIIDAEALLATATELRRELSGVALPFAEPGAEPARRSVTSAVQQLDDYVVPRLSRLDAPALAVIGGSTGAGKSTLVNSLIGAEVTRPGVLRPTTTSPVLVHHPDVASSFDDGRILGGLARVSGGRAAGPGELEVVASTTLSSGLAVLDAPDIDSVVDENRRLAETLLEAADLWVFVTTAARYADAVPWRFLRDAADRGVVLALVINRIPPGATTEVTEHLQTMLASEGLDGAPLSPWRNRPSTRDGSPTGWSLRCGTGWARRLRSGRSSRGRSADVGRGGRRPGRPKRRGGPRPALTGPHLGCAQLLRHRPVRAGPGAAERRRARWHGVARRGDGTLGRSGGHRRAAPTASEHAGPLA
ncbi:MAG: hypothetical protein R2704_17270 [Microthrixaceae bacterium]